MRWTADETVLAIVQQKFSELEPVGLDTPEGSSALVDGQADGIALIDLIEQTSTTDAGKILIGRRNKQVAERVADQFDRRMTKLLSDPEGLPDGKGKRTKLTCTKKHNLKSNLAEAFEYAALFPGPLPNRAPGLGRPPDNAVLIFIDDIDRACRAAGLKPGLRYSDPVSLPVALFLELAPLIWPGHPKNPRKLFERWKRHQSTLVRE